MVQKNSAYVTQVDPTTNLRTAQHGNRLFTDDNFRLVPKNKHLFYVSFVINNSALTERYLTSRHQNEFNMMVKKVDLPKFTIKTETVNQYNRKKIVPTGIDYMPVNISFHDDSSDIVKSIWANYYRYLFSDSDTAKKFPGSYRDDAYKQMNLGLKYGLNNTNSGIPFFTSVTMYQLNQKFYSAYTLINPKITSWNHDALSSADGGLAEHTMQLAYEAVTYDEKPIYPGEPPGFGLEHYDTTPSPIGVYGQGKGQLFGPRGVFSGAADLLGSFARGSLFTDNNGDFSLLNTVTNSVKAINTYQNAKNLTASSIGGEIRNIATTGISRPQGIYNSTFPVNDQSNVQKASPSKLKG